MKLELYLNYAFEQNAGLLNEWIPKDPTCVWIAAYLQIKAKNSPHFYEFVVEIATIQAITTESELFERNLITERALLLYKKYQWEELERDLNRLISLCDTPSWETSIPLLQRYFVWEYEGFSKD